VGINTAAPQEPLHLTITPGDGIGLRIDAAAIGHTPAIYLNHTGTGGRNFRIASYGNNFSLGSFVIRDDTAGADRLTIAAGGNIGIGTATPGSSLEVAGGIHARGGAPGAAGVNDNGYAFSGNGGDNDSGMFSSADGQVEFYANSTEIMRLRPDRVGIATTTISTLFQVGSATCNGTTWANASDRNLKENFRSVDAQELLAKVAALPLTEWNYKQDAAARHVGPVAQDFKAVFGLGTDDKTICTVDEGGVALAAIQGLNQKLEETRAENAVLKARLERLEKLLADSIHKGISKSLKP